MRALYAILLLTPLTLCANVQSVQNSGVRSQNSEFNNLRASAPPRETTTLNQPPPTDAWIPPAFDRYEGILNRMPFGQAPVVVAPVSATPAAPPPLPVALTKLTLCAINRTPAGAIEVGFVDASTNPPHSYLLIVGESEEGFTAVSADIDQELATIGKDGVNIDLKMGGKGPGVSTATPTPAPAPNPLPTAAPTIAVATTGTSPIKGLISPLDPFSWPIPGNVKAIDNALKMGITNDSYLVRLKKRREEVLAKQNAITDSEQQPVNDPVADARTAAIFEKMLRARNLTLIRKGEPGLGIPLTPEEDAQLVSEGVLSTQ